MNILVLASGRGSNFRALAEASRANALGGGKIVGLITNIETAGAVAIAKEFQIPHSTVASKKFMTSLGFARETFDQALVTAAQSFQPDLICLAGYMLVLSPVFLTAFQGKIVNIHPSLLPKYRGLNPQKQVLKAGDAITGCTVHWVVAEVDAGGIILQNTLQILDDDTETTLSERLLPIEHKTYVEAVRVICSSRS